MKIMCPTKFLLLITMILQCYAHSHVPVLLINYQATVKTNPFHEISSGYFTDIVNDITEKSNTVIVFAEENLSPEDISSQDDQGTPYTNVQRRFKDDLVTFLPAVYKPYGILTQILQLSAANYLNVSDASNQPVEILSRKFFYVFFKDIPGLSHVEKIRHHDDIMEQILTDAHNYAIGGVVAIYTGIHNPAEDIPEELPDLHKVTKLAPASTVQTRNTLFRFTGLSVKTAMRQSLDYNAPLHAEEFSWGETLKTRVTSADFVLEFYFLLGKETWLLDRVTLLEDGEEVGVTRMDIRVPWKRSFVCANPLIIVNNRDGSAIVIPQYQVEPFQHPRPRPLKRHAVDDNGIQLSDGKLVHRNGSIPAGPRSVKAPTHYYTLPDDATQRQSSYVLSQFKSLRLTTKYQYAKSLHSMWTSSILLRVKDPLNTTWQAEREGDLTTSDLTSATKRQDAESTTSTASGTSSESSQVGGGSGEDGGGDETEQITKYFSEAVVCCPYFTPGILMGCFVVFISGSIMLAGIFVLMNCCNSNDKFDQPQMLTLFDLPAKHDS